MPGGNFYAARHSYVHLPYEFGVDPGEGALKDNEIGPEAADIYTTGKT